MKKLGGEGVCRKQRGLTSSKTETRSDDPLMHLVRKKDGQRKEWDAERITTFQGINEISIVA